MYDLIVIGGGPAGLTATVYALRKRLNVLMVSRDLGGKTQYRLELPWVQDYQVIRGLEVVNKFKSELEYLDFARHMEAVDKVERDGENFVVHTAGGGELKTRAVIVASGTKQLRMKVPGEKEFMMKGLCYSALSYAPLFIERTTVVVGGRDLALRSAAELATIADRVYVVCPADQLPDTEMRRKVETAPNVTVLKNHEVLEVKGDDYARAVMLKEPGGSVKELAADAIFVEMALIPNSQMVAGLVDLDEEGRIKVDCAARSSLPGIFAAGDVASGFAEQVLIAVGEGAKALLSAYEYLLPRL
ncbi:MAG: FAD-dependent oxidoreductase [Anaerolineae bacterium]|jgi:alkyl hydroperoxide reductase subunit F|nr:FAD-dependent oxidoreductase [Anaerolineae bacterium]MCZ7553719.1 NAD(P)/FAD-dependent oxidoreductase [Anaerolineales bacterium]